MQLLAILFMISWAFVIWYEQERCQKENRNVLAAQIAAEMRDMLYQYCAGLDLQVLWSFYNDKNNTTQNTGPPTSGPRALLSV